MTRTALAALAYLGISAIGIALVSNSQAANAILCLLDLLATALILFHASENRCLDLGNPRLWAVLGYVGYGQLPLALNFFVFDQGYISDEAAVTMGILVLAGYRALIVGLLMFESPSTSSVSPVPHVSQLVPSTLALAGLCARLFIRNNVFDTDVVEWEWYLAFPFSFTPIAACWACSLREMQVRDPGRAGRERAYFIFTLAASAVCAVMDVSRKDTGMILLPIMLYVVFGICGVSPSKLIGPGELTRVALVLCVLGFVLMATRAFSWSRANESELGDEISVSFKERRANDMLPELAFVIDKTPSQYDYFWGSTIGSLLPIPRSVFPDRSPAHSYYVGLQMRGVNTMEYQAFFMGANHLSISAHLLGEGFANFGVFGSLAFEFVFGMLVSVFSNAVLAGRMLAMRIAYPCLLFFIFTQQRGDLAMMNSPWLQTMGVFVVVLFIATFVSPDRGFRYPGYLNWMFQLKR